MLAMGTYGALPQRLAEVHPRFRVPSTATLVAGAATAAFYVGITIISENVLIDTIYALGLMICFYYGLTAYACVWYFRRELRRSARDLVFKGVFPLVPSSLVTVSRRRELRRPSCCSRDVSPCRSGSATA